MQEELFSFADLVDSPISFEDASISSLMADQEIQQLLESSPLLALDHQTDILLPPLIIVPPQQRKKQKTYYLYGQLIPSSPTFYNIFRLIRNLFQNKCEADKCAACLQREYVIHRCSSCRISTNKHHYSLHPRICTYCIVANCIANCIKLNKFQCTIKQVELTMSEISLIREFVLREITIE